MKSVLIINEFFCSYGGFEISLLDSGQHIATASYSGCTILLDVVPEVEGGRTYKNSTKVFKIAYPSGEVQEFSHHLIGNYKILIDAKLKFDKLENQ